MSSFKSLSLAPTGATTRHNSATHKTRASLQANITESLGLLRASAESQRSFSDLGQIPEDLAGPGPCQLDSMAKQSNEEWLTRALTQQGADALPYSDSARWTVRQHVSDLLQAAPTPFRTSDCTSYHLKLVLVCLHVGRQWVSFCPAPPTQRQQRARGGVGSSA